MDFRKLKADLIFDGYRFIRDNVLIISDDGIVKDIVSDDNAGADVEILSGILSPGFINCHCHLELSHMRKLIPERTGLVDFVFKLVTGRYQADEKMYEAIEQAENEMLLNGIVAVGDICNTAHSIPQKRRSKLHYYNFIEATGWLPAASETRMLGAKNLADEFSLLHFPFSIVPHAPYSVSEQLWAGLQPLFNSKVVSIHNQETAFEDEFFLKGSGDILRLYQLMNINNTHHQTTNRSSIQSCFHKLTGASTAILVHNTFTKQDDIEHIKQQSTGSNLQTFFCLCVNANKYIEDALPDIPSFRKNDCQIVLGTDSLASNWSLNIMDEIKTIRSFFSFIPLEEVLQWATINGAKALEMDEKLGSFEKGKRPGIVLIDEKSLSAKRLI